MDTVPKAVELVTKAIEADNAKVEITTLASVDSVLKPNLHRNMKKLSFCTSVPSSTLWLPSNVQLGYVVC